MTSARVERPVDPASALTLSASPSWPRRAASALLPYLAPLVVIALERPFISPVPALADHFQFWAAGHLIATGRSPYERASWVEMTAYGPVPEGAAVNTVLGGVSRTTEFWLYPPQTAFLLAPFGALPISLGVQLLNLSVLGAAFLALVMAARSIGLRGPRLVFALTLAVMSAPFVMTVRDGHPVGVVLAGCVLAYVGIRDRRPWLVAVGATLVSIKPQIAIAFAAAAVSFLAVRRDVRGIALATASVMLVTLAAHLIHPFPVAAFLGAGGDRAAYDLSTTGALARDLGDGVLLTSMLILTSGIAVAAALRTSALRHRGAVGFSALLGMSLVIAPYAHVYDQLLAVPAAFAAVALARGSRAEPILASAAVILWLVLPWELFLWWPLLGEWSRFYQGGPLGAVPIVGLVGLALAAWVSRADATRGGARA